ncbi:type II toxin-antitoxin system RelE/ParE family toxin [Chryseobacterium echinoideorum]|uniref:type II toxin-antitoxin system RelE/ParE family toxin n=1 Tax=Chryseobacterium echinoideorum TaxID=1549648 RepID=UPI001184811B|nr:type II toxin-antitoxin system RelE/ParE family toxin [Chryseobacterium echinoideorum]
MEINFSDESLSDLRNIEEYLLKKWNISVFENFLIKLDEVIDIIAEGNVIFQNYENTKYHKILITKHNTLIYIVEDNVLKIIKILQNYQDPSENYESIKD